MSRKATKKDLNAFKDMEIGIFESVRFVTIRRPPSDIEVLLAMLERLHELVDQMEEPPVLM